MAPELLGKVLVAGDTSLRLTEVEAYCGAIDPGSHAYKGMTPRNAVMFGPPGHLYVYLSYGQHWCANIVTAPAAGAGAILLRAGVPVTGEDVMVERRGRPTELATGPGKLCQALAITGVHNDTDLCARGAEIHLADDGTPPLPHRLTTRIGLSLGRGDELEWRFLADRRKLTAAAPPAPTSPPSSGSSPRKA